MPFEDFLALDIADPEETPTRFLKTNLLTNETFSYYRGPKGCPYQSYIDRGEISGHPDFHRPVSFVKIPMHITCSTRQHKCAY